MRASSSGDSGSRCVGPGGLSTSVIVLVLAGSGNRGPPSVAGRPYARARTRRHRSRGGPGMRAEQVTGTVTYHGEGPVWSERWGGLRWLDMMAGDILSLAPDGTVGRRHVSSVV